MGRVSQIRFKNIKSECYSQKRKKSFIFIMILGAVHGFHESSFLVFMINLDTLEHIMENLVRNYAGVVTILCDVIWVFFSGISMVKQTFSESLNKHSLIQFANTNHSSVDVLLSVGRIRWVWEICISFIVFGFFVWS